MAGEEALVFVVQQFMLFILTTRIFLRMRRRIRNQRRRRRRRMYMGGRYVGFNPAAVLAALAVVQAGYVDRAIGEHRRSNHWWQVIALGTFDDSQWHKRFRMKKNTFLLIHYHLENSLRRTDTRMRSAIPTQKRLAIALKWMASGDLMRSVGDLFGVSEGSVSNIVYEVCCAIVEILLPLYIRFPRRQRLREIIQGYDEKWGFPQCGGAVDGSHIQVRAPSSERTDYYNRKGWYSMVLQGTVDYMYRFTNVYTGWPGSVHDARVFRNSDLFQHASRRNHQTLFPEEFARRINGVDVPVVLLGDAAYPHLPWLMKPYPDNGRLNQERKDFNFRLSSARMTVECAFGRLKGRWRCLTDTLRVDIERVPTIVTACCVLHNICEEHREAFEEQLFVPPPANNLGPAIQQVAPHAVRDALARLFAAEN